MISTRRNKIIVPFDDKKDELNVDLDKLSKGEMLNAIVGTSQQPTFVSKINKAKKPQEIAPFPGREVRENKINYGKGLDYIYGTKPLNDQAEDLNPFTSALKKIKPSASESEKLSWFKSAVVRAKSPNELHKAVEEALAAGARINACNDGEWSFAEYMILGTYFHKLDKGNRKKIIRKLMLSGAEFHDTLLQNKLIGEIYNELQPEVQPQIDKQLEELEKAGESAVQEGSLINLEIDNTTSYIEFSDDSKVEVAKILEANRGLILRMGNNAVEVKSEKGDIRYMVSNKLYLIRHRDHAIKRHIKVNGNRSPYDGDWPYWGNRLSKLPGKSSRVIKLLKLQQGKCNYCYLWFRFSTCTSSRSQ